MKRAELSWIKGGWWIGVIILVIVGGRVNKGIKRPVRMQELAWKSCSRSLHIELIHWKYRTCELIYCWGSTMMVTYQQYGDWTRQEAIVQRIFLMKSTLHGPIGKDCVCKWICNLGTVIRWSASSIMRQLKSLRNVDVPGQVFQMTGILLVATEPAPT